MDPVKYAVTVNSEPRDYRTGDFLNAIDELNCFFLEKDSLYDPDEYADALEMYARRIRRENQ